METEFSVRFLNAYKCFLVAFIEYFEALKIRLKQNFQIFRLNHFL